MKWTRKRCAILLLPFVFGTLLSAQIDGSGEPIQKNSSRSSTIDTIYQVDTIYAYTDDEYTQPRFEVFSFRRNIFLFQLSRITNSNFPSLTLNYQRLLGNYLGASASIGAPINRKTVYRQSNGNFSGIDAALGVRLYFSEPMANRFFIALDGQLCHNTGDPEGYVRNSGDPSFTVRNIALTRKRELITLSLGYQLISEEGISLDVRGGLGRGRIGIYSKDKAEFLTVEQEGWFTTEIPANTWRYYNAIHIGLGLGYSF